MLCALAPDCLTLFLQPLQQVGQADTLFLHQPGDLVGEAWYLWLSRYKHDNLSHLKECQDISFAYTQVIANRLGKGDLPPFPKTNRATWEFTGSFQDRHGFHHLIIRFSYYVIIVSWILMTVKRRCVLRAWRLYDIITPLRSAAAPGVEVRVRRGRLL
jgi:hypothetical protein